MNFRIKRRVAMLLLAVLAFAHASVSFASCPMGRGALAQVMAPDPAEACQDCATSMSYSGPQYANRCVAHCTADLQMAGLPVAILRAPADAPVLMTPEADPRLSAPTGLWMPPAGTPPPRILLHSFLI
jgi:hypothetical protein